MKKFATLFAAAAALICVSGTALADNVYLWGMNAKGKSVKAGNHGTYTRIYTAADLRKVKARKAYTQKATFCGKEYVLSKRQQAFLAAHKKAKHMVVVRARTGKGRYKKLCDA